ncbi:N-acetylated-alpha-linked acidic dipeptidase [Trichinella spiralis]|uniref:N-acetylated-alpha-linked acidic dipeptidase n=1 Tax=Trichinella spiralis TaxID=6334 RepID=A0ABR3KJF7_TRISP
MATTCGFINRKREEAVTNVKLSMRWEFAATMKSNQIKTALAKFIISSFSELGVREANFKLSRNSNTYYLKKCSLPRFSL